MLVYILISIAFGVAGIFIYTYFYNKGQFDDLEDIKYQIFREEEKKE